MNFKSGVRSEESEVRSEESEVRSQKSEVRNKESEIKGMSMGIGMKQRKSPFSKNCKPFTAYCLLPTAYCLLFTAYCLLFTAYCLLLTACSSSESDYSPKPKGYPRMDLPPQQYQAMTEVHPYSFEYSKSAVLLPDTFSKSEPHWIFVAYPSLKASIQLTYKPVQNNPKRLSGFINDAYKLAGKHQVRATGIREQVIKTKSGHTVVMFELAGDVPSYIQFFTTDTTTNYLRGALYFTVADKQDSLQPAINYLRKDVMHMLNTLKWKK